MSWQISCRGARKLWQDWIIIFPVGATFHDDVTKWKLFPRYWPFVRGIHRSPVNSPHKGQWRGALMFSLICARINGWVNNGEAGDVRRHRAHNDVNVMHFSQDLDYELINSLWNGPKTPTKHNKAQHVCIINSPIIMHTALLWYSWVR